VRIDVVPVRPEVAVSAPEATAAAREAVFNALQAAREAGFDHERADEPAPAVDSAEAIGFDPAV
jgi:hypothetical protein